MKICFWGNVGRAIKGNTSGGGELQITLLAKALVKSGFDVVIIDFQTSEDFITADGIKVLRIKGWNNGIRIIRTITHRLPRLYRSLVNQKADIYCCRIRDFKHILAFLAAKKVKAKFVIQMASDLDSMSFIMKLKYYHLANINSLYSLFNGILIEIVYPWLLKKADLILVQHDGQKNILQKRKINSQVFYNLIDMVETPVSTNRNFKDIIYVGWLAKRKGISEFFEIVKKAPELTFKVVGPPRDKRGYLYWQKLHQFKNVILLGELSHSETIYQIANSKALISTSPMEGFPNTFIEAWACGIPVLTLFVDPGSIIEKEGLGEVAHGNLNKLLYSIHNINTDAEFVKKAYIYVEQNHSLNEDRIGEIYNLFNELKHKKP